MRGVGGVRRLGAVVAVLGVALTGCSRVDPDAQVTLSGTAQHPDGSPLADADVALDVAPGPSVLLAVPVIIATFGQACRTALCGAEHTTRTDASGDYAFDLTGRDVQGLFGEEVWLRAGVRGTRASGALAGPAGTVDLIVRDEQVRLPTIRLWDPAVAIETDAVAWEELPPERGDPERTEVLFETLEGDLVWLGPAAPTGTAVDPRLVEDTTGGVAAMVTLPGGDPDGIEHLQLRSGTHGYVSDAGAPASRGAACEVVHHTGTRTALQPCSLTDGHFGATLDADLSPADPTCPSPEAGATEPCDLGARVAVQLGDEVPVELVVVRGCDDCEVVVGDRAFATGRAFEAFSVGTVASEVVLDGAVELLTEVSVWTGPAAGGLRTVDRSVALEQGAQDPPDEAQGTSGPSGDVQVDDQGLGVLPVAAAVLVAATLALVVVAARRRP